MPDNTCSHLSPVGAWCRLQNNFKCPAKPGRVGCPFPSIGSLDQRNAERSYSKERMGTEQNHIFAELTKPFPIDQIQWIVQMISKDKRRALVLASLNTQAVIDRLDLLIGSIGWSETYEIYPMDSNQMVQAKCHLTILNISKEEIGQALIPASTSVSAFGMPSLQMAVSDAFKRTASKFGIGRYLSQLESVWVDYDHTNKRVLQCPILPNWALPEILPTPNLKQPQLLQSQVQELQPEQNHLFKDAFLGFENSRPVSMSHSSANTSMLQTPAVQVATVLHDLNSSHAKLNVSTMPAPNGDALLANLIRQLRQLPGGKYALRQFLVGRNNWSNHSPEAKRALYAALRWTYYELHNLHYNHYQQKSA